MNYDEDNNSFFSVQTGCFFLLILAVGLSAISPLFIIHIINYFGKEKIIQLNVYSYLITLAITGAVLTTTLFISQTKIKNKKNGKNN